MNRKLIIYLVITFLLLSLCSSLAYASESLSSSGKAAVEEGIYPTGPTCSKLSTAKWDEISLYELTYGCLPAGWDKFFEQSEVRTQVNNISDKIALEVKTGDKIGPAIGNTFRALYLVKPEDIKAVIMGQDPAPQPGLATGLAFSTESGVSSSKVASIQRVLLEAQNEGKCIDLNNGDLIKWAQNGVILLNMALTIPCPSGKESCTIGGHIPLWGGFTSQLVFYIDNNANPAVFILWGSQAGQYGEKVTNKKHKVLKGGHPSPRVSGKNFFCKNYFNCANKWLASSERDPVNWNLIDSCPTATPCIWSWNSGTHTSSCSEKCALADCE
ncbi:MAG: uracil-DNA glycosylase [Nitrospirota bacterium]